MSNQFTLHAWPTPNSYKISIMLEECGLTYDVAPVNIGAGDQFQDDFKKLNPNSKMPVLVDHKNDDFPVFESGAILIYLAEQTGKFMPQDTKGKSTVIQWVMWQMAGFGPMLGQAHHFRMFAPEKNDYGIKRYTDEANRLYHVLETRLGETGAFVAGAEYTIADIAIYPWSLMAELQGVDLSDKPNIQKWQKTIGQRQAVQKGLNLMADKQKSPDDLRRMHDELMSGKKKAA